MLKIEENRGQVTIEFSGCKHEMIADVCVIMSAMLGEAKKHVDMEEYIIMLQMLTMDIEKEVHKFENQGGAFSLFSQSE